MKVFCKDGIERRSIEAKALTIGKIFILIEDATDGYINVAPHKFYQFKGLISDAQTGKKYALVHIPFNCGGMGDSDFHKIIEADADVVPITKGDSIFNYSKHLGYHWNNLK